MNDICWVIDVKPVWVYWMFLQGNRTWSCVHTPASASCSPLMSMDWGMLPTSMQDTCLGVFLKRSLGGANISWERKNFSGWVMGGRNPGHIYTSCVGHDALVVLLGNEYRAMPLLHTHLTAASPAPPRLAQGSAGGRTRRRMGLRPAVRCDTSPRAGRGRWAAAGSWAAGPAAGGASPAPSPPWSVPLSRSNDGSGWRGSRRCWCRPPPRWCPAGWTAPSGPASWSHPEGFGSLEIGSVAEL